MPGMGELVVILLIVLVVFGANKLPGIGDALGRSIKNFKKSSNVDDDDDDKELETKDKKQLAAKKPKELSKGTEADDGEWEEVVVRRKKKSAES
ncbi:MAG: twin-arginine translocation protein TatA/E family subunit [Myxococcales bacterium]|nr:twin-arginine translocation protein TatA/E family subunit [Myxococcales bacterium]